MTEEFSLSISDTSGIISPGLVLFREIMEELEESKLEFNEEAQEEQHLLTKAQVDTLKSHAQLVMFNDYDLITKWGINLTIH